MAYKVEKNGRIQWRGRIRKDGKMKQRHFDSKKEALDWEAEERKRDWSEKTDTVFSMGEWAQQYLDFATKNSKKTYSEKKKTFKEFFAAKDRNGKRIIDPKADVTSLSRMKVLHVLQVQFRKRSGFAANKDRKNLIAGWNWGVQYLGLPQTNPCKVDKFPEERNERYVPPEEDFWKVYQVTSGQDRVMLTTFLHLGARRGEIFRLRWTDIDFPNGFIRLATCKRQDGTREHDWLPMTSELKDQLNWWKTNRTFLESPYVFVCEDDYNFCKEYYGHPFKERRHFMKRICEKANVPPFGFHAVRHLSASILYHMGKPPSAIQKILRHKNAATTERYLQTLGIEDVRAHMEEFCHLNKGSDGRGQINGNQAEIIEMKDHLKKRSQVVSKRKSGKKSSKEGSSGSEPDLILPNP